jgi:uncharacterized protein (TIGR02246 family)
VVQQVRDMRPAIDAANRRFVEAYNRGDVAGAVAVYTEEATILPPGSPRVTGRAAIRQFWQGVRDSGVRAVALQTDDLEVSASGEMAREIGTATLTIGGEGGAEQTAIAKFVVVWKREDSDWRWHTDIWNTDA